MSNSRLWLRVAALTPLFVLGLSVQSLAYRVYPPLSRKLPVPFHRLVARILGLRIKTTGALPEAPVLILANHISWLDIVVLSALLPVSFVARADLAGWRGAGTLARLQNSIFIDRTRRQAAGAAARTIARRVAAGDSIVLFAEGTTSNGQRVLKFRSALIGEDIAVLLPVAIRYQRRDGLPLTRRNMPDIAWYGSMELLPHLKALISNGPIDVSVGFAPPIEVTEAQDRKQAVILAENAVRQQFISLGQG